MELLTISQVLDRTGIPRSTLFYWRNRGQFPQPLRVGGGVVWRSDVIDGWLRANGFTRRSHRDP